MLSTLRKIEKLRVMRRVLDGKNYIRTWLHSDCLINVFAGVWNVGGSEYITTCYKILNDDCIEWRTKIVCVEKYIDFVRVKCHDKSVWLPRMSVNKRVVSDTIDILEVV